MAKNQEQRQESKSLRELRKQLIKSRRENSQLRKRIHHLEGILIEIEDEALEEELAPPPKQEKNTPVLTCPSCGGTMVESFELRGSSYYKCGGCGSRGKIR